MASRAPPKLLFSCFAFLACFHLPITCYCKGIGMFVFGSSLVDNGNNNYLKDTMAKADFLPYGIDFPLGPSGRFTNGKNVIDLLGDHLQLPAFIPVFNDPSTNVSRMLLGVNYASGGSGILDETGRVAGNVTSLNQQIKNFEEVTLPILMVEQLSRGDELLPNYLFVVGSGGNDYSLNYFLGKSNTTSLEAFTQNLTMTLSRQLKKLYSLGARKFVIMGLYPLGCSPSVTARQPLRNGCIQSLNMVAHLFNAHLKSLVDVIKPQMPGSTLVFVNSYKIIRDIIKNPSSSKGFNDTSSACCEVGNGILCKRGGSTCENRSSYVYFDGLHPTEAVNVVLAAKAYASNLNAEVYPMNVEQLAKL
ncbi:hypothetical protein RJ639_013444 [Escallonia herrerae]|uniref:GDSL esterase/lipase n=1 Tax=Escallonia herrerae TaxID=1293975 RepID=A0AA88VH65_9ASTE|nr:hypothetical protein RJ639_013444 [Escallonia herrerae]